MTRRLEHVCFGTYGDLERCQLVLDVPELATKIAHEQPWPVDYRIVALTAFSELRNAGAPGLLIARMHGVPKERRWVQ